MTAEQALVQEIRAEIAKLADPVQVLVLSTAQTLRDAIKAEPATAMALALVGAELAAS